MAGFKHKGAETSSRTHSGGVRISVDVIRPSCKHLHATTGGRKFYGVAGNIANHLGDLVDIQLNEHAIQVGRHVITIVVHKLHLFLLGLLLCFEARGR